MVDIFKKEICNYCKDKKDEKNKDCKQKIIKIEIDDLTIYKCSYYLKKTSESISIEPPSPVTTNKDYIN